MCIHYRLFLYLRKFDNMENNDAYLVLEDGTVFKGKACGAIGTTTGEICFNTSMTGYQEIFTDPSYYNQVLVSTNVHVGNYGTYGKDDESDAVQIAGLICRNLTNEYNRPMADDTIQNYFEKHNLVGISDVDTREIVRIIRDKGAMNVIISSEILDVDVLKNQLATVPRMEGLELSSQVTTKDAYFVGDANSPYKVAVLDLGVKQSILDCLINEGAYLKVFPAKTSFDEVASWNPDGYFLSNGPGDPASMDYAIDFAKELIKRNLPTFGICLGHQVISLAIGLTTYKMHNGHRGANHPVLNIKTGKGEITSQNHGFAVKNDFVGATENVYLSHRNLNDDTVEGIAFDDKPIFCVQFHPEASPGPHDSRYLFKNFIANLNKN